MASVPTSTKRPAHGACTLKAAARATAKTVPGRAQGAAMSVSSGPLHRPRRRTASDAAANPSRIASAVAADAIHSELTIGRSRSVSEKSAR